MYRLIDLLENTVPATLPPEQYIRKVSFAVPEDEYQGHLSAQMHATRARLRAGMSVLLLAGETRLPALAKQYGGCDKTGRDIIFSFMSAGWVTVTEQPNIRGSLMKVVRLTELGRIEAEKMVAAHAVH